MVLSDSWPKTLILFLPPWYTDHHTVCLETILTFLSDAVRTFSCHILLLVKGLLQWEMLFFFCSLNGKQKGSAILGHYQLKLCFSMIWYKVLISRIQCDQSYSK